MGDGGFELMPPEEYYRSLERERGNEYKRQYTQSVLMSLVLSHGDCLTDRDYRTLNVNKIILGNGMYKVLIFSAESAVITDKGIPFPNSREYAYYVLANVSQELLSSHFVTYSAEVGGRYAALICLLNGDPEDILKEMDREIFSIIQDIVRICREHEVTVEYSYSLFHEGVASIPRAWREAEELRRFDDFAGQPLHERQALAPGRGGLALTGMERLRQLAGGVYERLCTGNREDTGQYLDTVIQELVYTGRHSVEEIFRRTRMLLFFLNMLLEQDPAFASVRGRVLETEGLEEIKSQTALESFLADRFEYLREGMALPADRAAEKAQRAKEYIDAHLTDVNLSVTSVAGELGVNPNTLSGWFKRRYGMSVAEYIHSQRVNLAVRILTTTRQPLAEVCRRCGYGSVNTLYRAFEKYKGRSPTQYRQRR